MFFQNDRGMMRFVDVLVCQMCAHTNHNTGINK
jgi:hypothetical protein